MGEQSREIMLDGVSTVINNRHAFVHERVLEVIARETERTGGVYFNKSEMASSLGCCARSLDRAVHRLREEGMIKTRPVFLPNGAQAGNEYRATKKGIAQCAVQKKRAGD